MLLSGTMMSHYDKGGYANAVPLSCSRWNFWFVYHICSDIRGVSDTSCIGKYRMRQANFLFYMNIFIYPLPVDVRLLISNVLVNTFILFQQTTTPWSVSASELYRPSDRRLSAKLVQTFADRGCNEVSVTDPYDRILGFLDRSRYFSIK
jgi:hypothetical protein